MAKFQSRYKRFSFYVNGRRHEFVGGHYATEDAEEIAYLTKCTDVTQIDGGKTPANTDVKPSTGRKPAAAKASDK